MVFASDAEILDNSDWLISYNVEAPADADAGKLVVVNVGATTSLNSILSATVIECVLVDVLFATSVAENVTEYVPTEVTSSDDADIDSVSFVSLVMAWFKRNELILEISAYKGSSINTAVVDIVGPMVSRMIEWLAVIDGIIEAEPMVTPPVTTNETVLDKSFVISTTRAPSAPAVPLYVPNEPPDTESIMDNVYPAFDP